MSGKIFDLTPESVPAALAHRPAPARRSRARDAEAARVDLQHALRREAMSAAMVAEQYGNGGGAPIPSFLRRSVDPEEWVAAVRRATEDREYARVWLAQRHAEQDAAAAVEAGGAGAVLQAQAEVGREGGALSPALSGRIQAKRGGGQPLEATVRRGLEGVFGVDFSPVRIHADGEADALNRGVAAVAFTVGADIFFRAGFYQPQILAGQHLLAHELTHVVQQRTGSLGTGGGGGNSGGTMTVGAADDRHEQEAEQTAHRVTAALQARGQVLTAPATSPGAALSRAHDPAVALAPAAPGIARVAAPLTMVHHAAGFGLPSLDDLRNWLDASARSVPGYPLLTVILGVDPITGTTVPWNAATIVPALFQAVPGGAAVLSALHTYGALDQAYAVLDRGLKSYHLDRDAFKAGLAGVIGRLSLWPWDWPSDLTSVLNYLGPYLHNLVGFAEKALLPAVEQVIAAAKAALAAVGAGVVHEVATFAQGTVALVERAAGQAGQWAVVVGAKAYALAQGLDRQVLPLLQALIAAESAPSLLPGILGQLSPLAARLPLPFVQALLSQCGAILTLGMAAFDAATLGPAAFLWVVVQNGVAGFLAEIDTKTPAQQIALLLNLARLLLAPSAAFSGGLLKGVVEGVWDGVVGLFGLVGSALTLAGDIAKAVQVVARQLSDPTVMARIRADIAVLQAELAPIVGEFSTPQGRARALRDARQVAGLVQGLVQEKVAAIARDMGRSVAQALLGAITGSDEHIGEGVGKLAGAALFNAALTWLTDGAYALAEAALPRLAEVVAEAAAHIGTLVAALEQALPPLLAKLAHLGVGVTSALGRQLGAVARTLADLLERLLGLATRADKDGAGEGAAGDGARGARGGHDTRDHGPRTNLQRRLDEAMAAALLILSPLSGQSVVAAVLTGPLGGIRVKFGLQVLEPVRDGSYWAIHGRINPEETIRTDIHAVGGQSPHLGADPYAELERKYGLPKELVEALRSKGVPPSAVEGLIAKGMPAVEAAKIGAYGIKAVQIAEALIDRRLTVELAREIAELAGELDSTGTDGIIDAVRTLSLSRNFRNPDRLQYVLSNLKAGNLGFKSAIQDTAERVAGGHVTEIENGMADVVDFSAKQAIQHKDIVGKSRVAMFDALKGAARQLRGENEMPPPGFSHIADIHVLEPQNPFFHADRTVLSGVLHGTKGLDGVDRFIITNGDGSYVFDKPNFD